MSTCPFESPRDQYTNFVSRICPRAEALGQILKRASRRSIHVKSRRIDTFLSRSPVPQPRRTKMSLPRVFAGLSQESLLPISLPRQSTRKCRHFGERTSVSSLSFSCSRFFTSFTQLCKPLYESMLMVKRSVSLIIYFMKFCFCDIDMMRAISPPWGLMCSKECVKPIFCLYPAMYICIY